MPLPLLAVLPSPVLAHVRWFVDVGRFANAEFLMDVSTALVAIGAAAYAMLALHVHRSARFEGISARLAGWASAGNGLDWRLVGVLTGMMLIGNAMTGVYLAPNIELPFVSLVTVGAVAQVLVGILLLLQITYSVSGALVLVVAVLTLGVVSPWIMMDYVFEFVALAVALILVGPSLTKIDRRICGARGWDSEKMSQLAVPVIRVGVGLTLATLAVHNKLLSPGLMLAFLEEYHFNFMPMIGFAGFSDLHFAFAAGIAELTLGLLILFGVATRFAVATVTVFFVTTLILLGPVELLGHAPLVGIAVVLILRGSGRPAVEPAMAAVTRETAQPA
ncbi:MAG: hypothetical protein O2973_02275 [Gemmatimonadetes bacterium]|nr:hypothetical protein [Gemmatimonadota bacterium]